MWTNRTFRARMPLSVPVPCLGPTASGKRSRADPLLGRGSVHDDTALPINCIQPTAVFTHIHVGGHDQKCLVDTGATVSLVSRELVSGPLKPCSLKARGIGGEELQVLGMKELKVRIGTLTISHQFLVVGMRNTCILGADFLRSGRMVVDLARVFFGSLVIKLIFEICATLTHLWGRLGEVKKNMYNLGE